MTNKNLDFEIRRKSFHLASLIFPIGYLFIDKLLMMAIVSIIAGATLYLDIYRHKNEKIQKNIQKFLGFLLRDSEKSKMDGLSGSSYMAIGFFITVVLFSKELAITSWLILIICDSIAAIAGMQYGEKLPNGKSYIGSGVFFMSCFMVSIFSYFLIGFQTSFFIILVSSMFTTGVEFYAKELKMDDNLSIPVTYALITYVFSLVF